MSQRVFADHVGVKSYIISELEVSRYPRASEARLKKLAKFLGVEVAQLNPAAFNVIRGQKGGRWPKPQDSSQRTEETDEELALYDRPKVRGDCLTAAQRGDDAPDGVNCARPCPFVSCKHHLFVELNQRSSGMKLNFPEFDVWKLSSLDTEYLLSLEDSERRRMETENPGSSYPSCSLDVADCGGVTLEMVGVLLNVTRERARQLECHAKSTYRQGLVGISFSTLDDLDGPISVDQGNELQDLIESQTREIATENGIDTDSFSHSPDWNS